MRRGHRSTSGVVAYQAPSVVASNQSPLLHERGYASGMGEAVQSFRGLMDPEQKEIIAGIQTRAIRSFTAPGAVFAGSEIPLTGLKVQPSDVKYVKKFSLHCKITITVAGAAIPLIPAEFWVKRLELWSDAGSGQRLQQWFSEGNWFLNNFSTQEEYEGVAKNCLHSPKWTGKSVYYPVNTVLDVWIPFNYSFFENFHGGFDFGTINKDIEFRITLRSDIRANTTAATFNMSVLEAVFDQISYEKEPAALIRAREYQLSKPISVDFLEMYDSSYSNVTINAGAMTDQQLDKLSMKTVAFMMVGIRASADTTANNQLTTFLDLGPTAAIDIKDQSGVSIFGQGNAVQVDWLKNCMIADKLPGMMGVYSNIMMINFSRFPQYAPKGVKTGMLYIDSNNFRLQITPDTALVAGVQTLTPTIVVGAGALPITAGKYRIGFDGEFSKALPFNAAAADMKAAFESMRSTKEFPGGPVTVTFSAGINAAAATCTFGDARTYPIITIADDGLVNAGADTWAVECKYTTYPTRGWVNGSTYNLAIYAFCYKNVERFGGNLVPTEY